MTTSYPQWLCRDINGLVMGYLLNLPTELFPVHRTTPRPKTDKIFATPQYPAETLYDVNPTTATQTLAEAIQTYAGLAGTDDPFSLVYGENPGQFLHKFTVMQYLRQVQAPGWEIQVLFLAGWTKLARAYYDEMQVWATENSTPSFDCPFLRWTMNPPSYFGFVRNYLDSLFGSGLLSDDQLTLLIHRNRIPRIHGKKFSPRITQEIVQHLVIAPPNTSWAVLIGFYGQEVTWKFIQTRSSLSPDFFHSIINSYYLTAYPDQISEVFAKIDFSLGLTSITVHELTRFLLKVMTYGEEHYPRMIPLIKEYYRRCLTCFDSAMSARHIHRVIGRLLNLATRPNPNYTTYATLSSEKQIDYLVFLYETFFSLNYDGQAIVSQLTIMVESPYRRQVLDRIRPYLDLGLASGKIRPGKWLRKQGLCQ